MSASRFFLVLMFPLMTLSGLNPAAATESGAAQPPAKEKDVFSFAGSWKTARNEEVQLSKYKGKKTILALFYSSCSTICPMTASSLKRVESALAKKKLEVQVLMVSIDAGDQNSKQMAEFAKKQKIDKPLWHLLAGKTEQTEQLAALLGLGIGEKRSDPSLHQMHSEFIVVIDEKGKILMKTPSLDPNIPEVEKALAAKAD